jgi:hypothetical protein
MPARFRDGYSFLGYRLVALPLLLSLSTAFKSFEKMNMAEEGGQTQTQDRRNRFFATYVAAKFLL